MGHEKKARVLRSRETEENAQCISRFSREGASNRGGHTARRSDASALGARRLECRAGLARAVRRRVPARSASASGVGVRDDGLVNFVGEG